MSGIIETAQPYIVGGLVTVGLTGLGFTLKNLFNRLTGGPSIGRNVDNIARSAKNLERLSKIVKDENAHIHGILFVNADHAHLALRADNDTEEEDTFQRMDLRSDARMAQFEQAKEHLANLPAMMDAFLNPKPLNGNRALLKTAKQAQQSWVRPTLLQTVTQAFGSSTTAHDRLSSEVNDAEMDSVEALAGAQPKDINLSGACHIALKWTDDQGKAWIVVMPTNKKEAALMKAVRDGGYAPGQCDATTIIKQLAALHKPDEIDAPQAATEAA